MSDIFQQLQQGASSARANDVKVLKSVILDWLVVPSNTLSPPISANSKADRGFKHEATGALLCPLGVDWYSSEQVQFFL